MATILRIFLTNLGKKSNGRAFENEGYQILGLNFLSLLFPFFFL